MTELTKIPPGQQVVASNKWPVIGEREPANSEKTSWTLSLGGLVESPATFSTSQLLSMPQTSLVVDIHCVTRWSKLDVPFSGVLLKDLLRLVEPKPNAKFVSFVSRSARKHSTSLPLDVAIAHDCLIALAAEGQPIESGHGGPIRNIVPRKYFYKSVKWLEEIEFLEEDRLGYWEADAGYHNLADPWKEQRYMAATIDRRTAATLIDSKDFSNRDLRSIDASNRNLDGLNAVGAKLRDAAFDNCSLAKADFSDANLSNASFVGANLSGAKFSGTDVEGADFSGADLTDVDLSGSSLIGASFFSGERTHAKLSATTFSQHQLDSLNPGQREFVVSIARIQ
ncbi:molybdopterin-dependent oxidoreductase [Mariniblastus fucicola]|uniref:Serine/threonine-protein kinase B n=1 Tax=Mariniblastus fucicola TaxID=980251 RepID=A0A5B9PHW0_9BACT|nr:molybdopterin-dependent oxidoreductase [Mariniblastus fucicola]QEG24262.1 Serine/threonine-protein kinase B [Mariniblastus fucicola]